MHQIFSHTILKSLMTFMTNDLHDTLGRKSFYSPKTISPE